MRLLEGEVASLQRRLSTAKDERAALQQQLDATRARLAAAEAAAATARADAADARREAAALGAELQQAQLLARCDSAVGRRQVGMLMRLLSCPTTEAEGLLEAVAERPSNGGQ